MNEFLRRVFKRDLNWMVKVFERMSGKRDFDLIVEQLMRQSSSIALQLWDRDENSMDELIERA